MDLMMDVMGSSVRSWYAWLVFLALPVEVQFKSREKIAWSG
jgi:hypothetical protein